MSLISLPPLDPGDPNTPQIHRVPTSAIHGALALYGGPLKTQSRTLTASGEIFLWDSVVRGDATGGNVTLTLPAVADAVEMHLFVKRVDSTANTLTVDGNASETIDGDATLEMSAKSAAHLYCNGTSWDIL